MYIYMYILVIYMYIVRDRLYPFKEWGTCTYSQYNIPLKIHVLYTIIVTTYIPPGDQGRLSSRWWSWLAITSHTLWTVTQYELCTGWYTYNQHIPPLITWRQAPAVHIVHTIYCHVWNWTDDGSLKATLYRKIIWRESSEDSHNEVSSIWTEGILKF